MNAFVLVEVMATKMGMMPTDNDQRLLIDSWQIPIDGQILLNGEKKLHLTDIVVLGEVFRFSPQIK